MWFKKPKWLKPFHPRRCESLVSPPQWWTSQGPHHLGKKVLPRMFLRYALCAGGIWKRDITVADTDELENLDVSEIHARRLNAKEVTLKTVKFFYLPNRRRNSKPVWKSPWSPRIHSEAGTTCNSRRTRGLLAAHWRSSSSGRQLW